MCVVVARGDLFGTKTKLMKWSFTLVCPASLKARLELCNKFYMHISLLFFSMWFCSLAIFVLIAYTDRTSLFCLSEHLYDPETMQWAGPTPFCNLTGLWSVADLGGVSGVQMHPPLAASNVFCIHNCTTPSTAYAAVACSNNNQAQLHTHVLVPYWYPDIWLGLELLRDIQFGLPAILNVTGSGPQQFLGPPEPPF